MIAVGCALAAQLRARKQTWRDKRATYIQTITAFEALVLFPRPIV